MSKSNELSQKVPIELEIGPEPPDFKRVDTGTRHSYKLNGKDVTGVTTILGVIAKPQLIPWASNMAVDYIVNSMEKDKPYTLKDLKDVLKEARTAHAKRASGAADIGTLVHNEIETYVNRSINENKGVPLELEYGHPQNEVRIAVQKFITWSLANNVVFLISEKTVFSEDNWYAGTLDLVLRINGKLYIGDIKTSSGIYGREFFAQTVAYQLAIEEMTKKWGVGYTGFPDEPVEGRIIIRCGKDGSFETKESLDFEKDKQLFLGALAVYRNK